MTLPTADGAELRTTDTAEEMWAVAEDRGVTRAREAYPSGWLWLAGAGAVGELLEALLAVDPDDRFGTGDLAAMTSSGDADVEAAVDALISLGVLVAEEGTYWVDEHSAVYHAAGELSAAVERRSESGERTGFGYVSEPAAVRLLVDALLEVDPGRSLSQTDLHRLTGVSRKRVWVHVERLVELGLLVEESGSYALDPSSAVLRRVRSLDAAVVGAVLSPSHP